MIPYPFALYAGAVGIGNGYKPTWRQCVIVVKITLLLRRIYEWDGRLDRHPDRCPRLRRKDVLHPLGRTQNAANYIISSVRSLRR